MWKRLLPIILIIIIGSLFWSSPILADSSGDVTVTARGYICGAPGLTITWISDKEVKLDWVMGSDAVNTMVRAKIGSVPTSRTDGYLVYSGNATTFTDTAIDLDKIATYVYYIAFGQNAAGIWEEEGDSGFIGGAGMILIALAFMSLSLMAIGYWVRRPAVGIAAGAAWLLVAGYSFVTSTATWDIYFALYVVAIGLSIVSFMEGFVLKPKEDVHDQMLDDDADWKEWDKGQKHFQERLDVRRKNKAPRQM